MDPQLLTPIAIGALVLFAIARRVRRNIGRQSLRPGAMWFRIGLFALLGVLFAVRAARDMDFLGALLGGVAAGAALGWFGLRHTKFERTAQGVFYTPHTYIGLAVSMLLIARLAYRFLVNAPAMQAAAQANQDAFSSFQRSPLTLAIFGVLIGYYCCYYLGVLQAAKHLPMTGSET